MSNPMAEAEKALKEAKDTLQMMAAMAPYDKQAEKFREELKAAAGCVVRLLLVPANFLIAVYTAYAVVQTWRWHLEEYAPAPPVLVVWVVLELYGLLKLRIPPLVETTRPLSETVWQTCGRAFAASLLLAVMWVATYFK